MGNAYFSVEMHPTDPSHRGVTAAALAAGRDRIRTAPDLRPLHPRALEVDDALDALPGLTYVTDADGLLLACSRGAWTRFARRNDGASIADPKAILGTSIYTAMNTEATRQVHRRIADGVLEGDQVAYRWCCDGPGVQRDMRMTIRALRLADGRGGLLYHSRTLAVRYRKGVQARTPGLPEPAPSPRPATKLRHVCCLCNIGYDPSPAQRGSAPTTAEEQPPNRATARRASAPTVRISYGICSDCWKKLDSG